MAANVRVGVFFGAGSLFDQRRHLSLERIDSRIGMTPGVGEVGLVERSEPLPGIRLVEQCRAGRDEQPD